MGGGRIIKCPFIKAMTVCKRLSFVTLSPSPPDLDLSGGPIVPATAEALSATGRPPKRGINYSLGGKYERYKTWTWREVTAIVI